MMEGQAETYALLRSLAGRAPIETHISAIFIGADTVWKLRRAVRLPFLDFTSLGERERTARRELALNAAAAPGMYRDVVPVRRAPDGTVALGGTGAVIDWVLRMARVPEADFLDAMAARGAVGPGLLDALGDTVAAYHAALPPLQTDPNTAFAHLIDGNVASARGAGLPDADIDRWTAAIRRELSDRAAWLCARRDAGFVRRIHGDLHLGNLCLWHGKPVPFDALEFDEALAEFDVGYDLAFLLMDLEARLDRAAANRVLNRYLARSLDWGLVAGLRLFISLRAMVRAHVEARSGHAARAADYLARALAALEPAAPVVLAIGGLPGTGKSTLARALAPQLGPAPGAVVVRSDEIRKRLNGVAPEQRLPPSAYTREASAAVFAELTNAVRVVAAAGQAVIADATFMADSHRAAIAAVAGAHFVGVWLHAPVALLEARVAARTGDASDADLAVLRDAAKHDPGAGGWLAVDATDADVAQGAVAAALAPLMC
jgi:aminoglycoside phosphotransferase family enzyme/predicted kinase